MKSSMMKMVQRFAGLLIAAALLQPGIPAFGQQSQDYVWLHVDGKYIKRSPLAVNQDQIWMGAGPAWNFIWSKDTGKIESGAAWLKSKGINLVQNNFATLPTPLASQGGTGAYGATIAEIVNPCRASYIYP